MLSMWWVSLSKLSECRACLISARSDADALAKVNTDLISNFMDGLKHAGLTPKRFLLQTGDAPLLGSERL